MSKIGKDIIGSKCGIYVREQRHGGKIGEITYFIGLTHLPGKAVIEKSHGKQWIYYSGLFDEDNIKWMERFLTANTEKVYHPYEERWEYMTRDTGINETFKQLVKLGDDGLRPIAQTMDPKDLKGIRKVLSAMKKIL